MKNKKTLTLVFAALFAALTVGLTYFSIPIGNSGYIHLGDVIIYLGASILPLPYAIAAAAIGGALTDLLAGYAMWAPFSFIIKALLTLSFTSKNDKILNKRNMIAPAIGLAITVGGYYLAETIIYKSFGVALAGIPWNLIQAVASGAVYYIASSALNAANLKNRIDKNIK